METDNDLVRSAVSCSRQEHRPCSNRSEGDKMRCYKKAFMFFACAVLLLACTDQQSEHRKGSKPGSGSAPPPADVGYIEVQPHRIVISTELPGRVIAYRTAEIRPQVSGIIQSRLFKEGSFVEEGQQLYQIDPARYEVAYQRAKARLQDAKAYLKRASALALRYESLIGAKAVSEQEYDEAIADSEQAAAAVALAEAEVRAAGIDLDYTRVNAPISGYIGPSAVTEGALVTAQQQTALATIRQLNPVYVDLSQSAADTRQLRERIMADRAAGKAQTRYPVFILLENSGGTYPHTGTLDATDLSVDPQTGAIRLRSVIPNPDIVLLPGMFVRASLKLAGATDAIVIPQKSVIIEPGGEAAVWVIGRDNKAEKRQVRTGAPYRNNWVILEGLQAGDRVIVEGTMMLRGGAAVKPTALDAAEVTGVMQDPAGSMDNPAPPSEDSLEAGE